MQLSNIRWADAAHTSVNAVTAEGYDTTIPAVIDNVDWARLVASGVAILPFEPPQIDYLSKPLDRLDFWLVAAAASVSKWSVRDRIAAMADGLEKREAIAWFEDATIYRRNDPLLCELAALEGLTPEEVDALWAWAVAN